MGFAPRVEWPAARHCAQAPPPDDTFTLYLMLWRGACRLRIRRWPVFDRPSAATSTLFLAEDRRWRYRRLSGWGQRPARPLVHCDDGDGHAGGPARPTEAIAVGGAASDNLSLMEASAPHNSMDASGASQNAHVRRPLGRMPVGSRSGADGSSRVQARRGPL